MSALELFGTPESALPATDRPVLSIDKWPTNGHLIADCARLGYLNPGWRTLDPTYGYGTFWSEWRPDELVACDINPSKSPLGYPVDFTALPWAERSFAAVVFDPPYKLNGTPSDTDGVDERFGVDGSSYFRWQDRMALIRAGARECARVADTMLLVKCQDQVVSSKIRWQTRAVADEVEPLGFGLRARLDFLGGRGQPGGREQINPRSCSSQLLVFQRDWWWSDLPKPEGPARIDRMVNKLRRVWHENPDQRLGQLVSNLGHQARPGVADVFYVDDDEMEAILDER